MKLLSSIGKPETEKSSSKPRWKDTLIIFVIYVLLVNLVSLFTTREERANVGIGLLVLDWLAFGWLLLVDYVLSKRPTKDSLFSKLVQWTKNNKLYFLAIMPFSLFIIFQETHQIRLVNNMTIAFSYSVTFYCVFSLIHQLLKASHQELNLKSQKFYIIYGVVIFVLLLQSKSMDDRDPFGTQFQYFVLCWAMFAHLVITWVLGQWRLVQQLKNEGSRTELMHLKSQINPHFFFNTLNNLYGLAREKSDETPDVILKLSNMMRYTIYQGQKDWVRLQDEIDYLNNYIELQQIRFHKEVKVNIDIDVADPEVQIPPLLFINVLENAYKHGVETLSDKAFVNISLTTTQERLTFRIINNFDPSEQAASSGIGLDNLQKRLALLYPENHSFKAWADQDMYMAELSIPIKQGKGTDGRD